MATLTEETTVKVLVVDDEPDILKCIGKYLLRRGFAVEVAAHPGDALDMIGHGHYDLILSDVKMPEMDGLSLLRKVKESSPLTEVVLMTGYASVESAVSSMKLGAFDYVMKPFHLDEVHTVIQRALEHGRLAGDRKRFKDSDQLKDEFLRSVSHELRTPLTSINAASKLLLEEYHRHGNHLEGNTPDKMLSIIDGSTNRMLRLIGDIFDTFRFHDGKVILNAMAFSAERMISDCMDECLVPCQERGLTLKAEVEKGLPAVTADPVKLQQAVMNLVGNAMKFTPAGGSITVGVRREGDAVEIFVQDSGLGIPRDKQEKIFEKFYQVDGTTTRQYPGIGLGLSLVKAIVDAHEGTISLESIPGQGSTFTIRIPVRSAPVHLADISARGCDCHVRI